MTDRNTAPYSKAFYGEIEKEIDNMKKKVLICPLCGQPVNVRNNAEKYFPKKQEDSLK